MNSLVRQQLAQEFDVAHEHMTLALKSDLLCRPQNINWKNIACKFISLLFFKKMVKTHRVTPN